MKHIPLFCLAICLISGCSKESDREGATTNEPPRKKTPGLSAISQGDNGGAEGKPVNNAYAEKNWPVGDEPENEWTQEFAEATTPEEKMAIIGRKQSSGPELLGSLVRAALREPDERVRIEAAQTITSFIDQADEVADLVAGAAHDPSSEVRIYAMEAARELLPATQLEVYKKTIAVPDYEVRKMTIVELGRMLSKPAFEVLMTGLQNPEPAFREEVNFEIKLLVNQNFDTYEQAKNWWDGPGAVSFSDNMIHTGGNE